MSKRFSAPAACLSATPCVKAIAPNSVTSQAPSSHLGMNLKTCRCAGLRSNELLVTNTFTSYLPSSRASSRGSDGNFVVEGLAVGAGSPPDHQEKRSSQAVHSEVHEAATRSAAIAVAARIARIAGYSHMPGRGEGATSRPTSASRRAPPSTSGPLRSRSGVRRRRGSAGNSRTHRSGRPVRSRGASGRGVARRGERARGGRGAPGVGARARRVSRPQATPFEPSPPVSDTGGSRDTMGDTRSVLPRPVSSCRFPVMTSDQRG